MKLLERRRGGGGTREGKEERERWVKDGGKKPSSTIWNECAMNKMYMPCVEKYVSVACMCVKCF